MEWCKASSMRRRSQDVEDQFKNDKQYAATGFLVNLTEPEAGDIVTENVPMRMSLTLKPRRFNKSTNMR
jgi:hypothetical protein